MIELLKLTRVSESFVSRSNTRVLNLEGQKVQIVDHVVSLNGSDTRTEIRLRIKKSFYHLVLFGGLVPNLCHVKGVGKSVQSVVVRDTPPSPVHIPHHLPEDTSHFLDLIEEY